MGQVALDHERAKFAFAKITEAKKSGKKAKYLTNCKKMPSQIKINGFGLVMAFLCSKEDSKPLFIDIAKWLVKTEYIKKTNIRDENFEIYVLETITQSESFEYRQMSNETMALLVWLKRFAEGMLK